MTGELVPAARALAEELLADELPLRWEHVQAVGRRAESYARMAGLADELSAAAWLHDIGYASRLQGCGFHPIDGARHLRAQGWPAGVYNLVAYHSCAVVEAGYRGLKTALGSEFTDEPGAIRDALWAADATTGPDGTHLSVEERVSEVVARYGEGTLVANCMLAIAPELSGAYSRTMQRIESAGHSM